MHACANLYHMYFHLVQTNSCPPDRTLYNLKNPIDQEEEHPGKLPLLLCFWLGESDGGLSPADKNFSCRNLKKGMLEQFKRGWKGCTASLK